MILRRAPLVLAALLGGALTVGACSSSSAPEAKSTQKVQSAAQKADDTAIRAVRPRLKDPEIVKNIDAYMRASDAIDALGEQGITQSEEIGEHNLEAERALNAIVALCPSPSAT